MKANTAPWNKEKVQALLDKSDLAVTRALVRIYERQTSAEQQAHTTTEANGVGFSAFDAEFCSDLAKKVMRGWTLSPKQLAICRNKVRRYHRQLVEIANANAAGRVQSIEATIESAEPVDTQAMIDAAELAEILAMQAAERREDEAVAAYKAARDGI